MSAAPPHPAASRPSTVRLQHALVALAALAGLAVALFPPAGFTPMESRTAALAIVAIGFWATGALPEHLTALWFLLLGVLLTGIPAAQLFSGLVSAAWWLVLAGLVLGVAIDRTGLGRRIAGHAAQHLGRSYPRLIMGVVIMGVGLSFLMPSSMGRAMLLIPIALAIAEHAGFEPGSKGRTGVVLAAAFGCHVPSFAVLPANLPNMVLVGTAETLFGVSPLYGEYLLLHFPVLGLLKGMLIVGLILWMYPDRPRARPAEPEAHGRLKAAERHLLWVLLAALALWITDFLHHVSPAWVALGAALVLMLPGVGVVTGRQFRQDVNFNSLFFVAGIMGLGAAVAYSGLGAHLAHALTSLVPLAPEAPALNFTSLALVSVTTGLLTTLPGVPAVLTPLAEQMSAASGLPLQTVLMTQVLGFSTAVFPYQSAPLVVAMQVAGERLVHALRLTLALAAASLLLLFPLDYLWWRLLGWL